MHLRLAVLLVMPQGLFGRASGSSPICTKLRFSIQTMVERIPAATGDAVGQREVHGPAVHQTVVVIEQLPVNAASMSAFDGDLNRSTQHFVLKGKDGVSGDKLRISSRFYCGRQDGAVGSLAAGRVAESDWPGVW